jgi:hypothetical protein
LLAFAEHLGIQNAGEEDVDQLTRIIRATDYDVNFYLSPSNGFACGKSQIDTASRNKLMGTKFMESELVPRLVLIIRFEATEIWHRRYLDSHGCRRLATLTRAIQLSTKLFFLIYSLV